jgi:large subunit ribosomal protein L10
MATVERRVRPFLRTWERPFVFLEVGMTTAKKVERVEEVSEKLKRASGLVITDYRGLTVAQLQDLRRKLRAGGVDYLVVKNTLARRAAAANGLEVLEAELVGPVGLAVGYDEPVVTAKLVNDYIKQARRLVIKGGLLGKQVLDADGVRQLADLPGREALLGQLAGTLNHSVAQLAGALNGAVANLANGLEAYRKKLESSGAAA